MSWIREIDEADATGQLAEVYEKLTASRGKVANILKVHSLDPAALEAHLDLYMTVMFSKAPLTRLEREAIAVAVSAENQCAYCVAHHLEALRRYERNADRLEAITHGHHANVEPRLAAMLDYARRLTREPGTSEQTHIEALRAAGLSDEEVLRVTLITAYFNFVNRIALGLGVAHSQSEMEGYTV